jgi:lysophospholipase L1-like esterase
MKLAHLALGGLGALSLWLLLGRRRLSPPFLTVGDSIAEGIGQALVEFVPGQAATEAQSGEGVGTTASRLSARLSAHPEAKTIVLATGVNSLGTAREVMDETVAIVDRIRETGREVVLVGPPPAMAWDEGSSWRAELAALERLHGRMAGRLSLFQLLGDARNEGYFDERYGTPGGLHPNEAGYELAARAVLGR